MLGNAPIISDLVKGKIKDPLAQKAFEYGESIVQVGMWVALPPATPDGMVATYVKAFEAASNDPQFQTAWVKIDPNSPVASKAELDKLVHALAQGAARGRRVHPGRVEAAGSRARRALDLARFASVARIINASASGLRVKRRCESLVTGASGYAGFYAALRLAAAGHTVSGIVPTSRAAAFENLADAGQRGHVAHRRRLRAGELPLRARAQRRHHSHHAGQEAPVRDRSRAVRRLGGAGAAHAAAAVQLYTTGCSIFGKVPVAVMDERTEPNPEHPLAFRRGMEREALALGNVGTVVLRPGFMFGNDGFNSVSADWFAMAEEGEAVFRGDRERGWSWIHITDLAEAYRLVVEAEEGVVDGEIFHLGDERRPRSLDVMRACPDAAGYRATSGSKGRRRTTISPPGSIRTSSSPRRRHAIDWDGIHGTRHHRERRAGLPFLEDSAEPLA